MPRALGYKKRTRKGNLLILILNKYVIIHLTNYANSYFNAIKIMPYMGNPLSLADKLTTSNGQVIANFWSLHVLSLTIETGPFNIGKQSVYHGGLLSMV